MRTPAPVVPNRKLAYNYLLYVAMLEVRGLQSVTHPWPKWQIISPRYWIREFRFIRYCGALADALHNLAVFSSYDFERFDEDSFWSGIDLLKSRFDGMADNYRGRFEQRLSELESGTSPQHAWLPAEPVRPLSTAEQ
jgi:hypothetical protein